MATGGSISNAPGPSTCWLVCPLPLTWQAADADVGCGTWQRWWHYIWRGVHDAGRPRGAAVLITVYWQYTGNNPITQSPAT